MALAYTPTTTLGDKEAVDLPGISRPRQLGDFTDGLPEKGLIGENWGKANKGKVLLPVSRRDDVAAGIKARFSTRWEATAFRWWAAVATWR